MLDTIIMKNYNLYVVTCMYYVKWFLIGIVSAYWHGHPMLNCEGYKEAFALWKIILRINNDLLIM